MIHLLALLACSPDDPTTGGSGDPGYGVPLAPDSPWPKFRRDETQSARGAVSGRAGSDAQPWTFATGKGIFSSPTIGGDGTVYIGSADRNFYALNPDGTEKWRFETGEIIDSSGLLDDLGRVYFGSGDGHLYALDAKTGEQVWRFAADDPSVNAAFINWFEGNVAMLSTGDLVVPNDNFFVYGIDRNDGSVNWRFKMQDQTWSLPAVDAATDQLWIGNNNLLPIGANTYAIDGATGAERWSTLEAKGSVAASPLFADDQVVTGGFDGFIRAQSAATGALLWETGVRDHIYGSAASLGDGTLVVPGADGTMYALNPETGALVWAFDTADPIRSSPAVSADDQVIFGGGDGRLYVLNGDGTLRWSMLLVAADRNDLNASPALGPDGIVVGGESGEVFFVPWDWCLNADDDRCATGGEAIPDDGVFLWPTTRWGSAVPTPAPLAPAEPVALSLLVREGGDTALDLLDAVAVAVTPPVPVEVTVSADRRFLLVQPPPTGWGADQVSLHVTGTTIANPERDGLVFGAGQPGPALDATVDLAIASGVDSAVKVGQTWELWRLAAPLPTILPSYNQIGFDSLHYRVTVVTVDGDVGVGWIEGALPGGLPDAGTKSMFPVRFTLADGGIHLDADAGMTLEAMGAVLTFSDFQISAALGADGGSPDGATLAVKAICGDIPLYGLFLRDLGFCNPDTDQLTVFGGALLDARAVTPTTDPGAVTFAASNGTLTATFTGAIDIAAHRLAVLVLDGAGDPVAFDYGTGTAVSPGAVTLPVGAELPADATAVLLVDGVPAATGAIAR